MVAERKNIAENFRYLGKTIEFEVFTNDRVWELISRVSDVDLKNTLREFYSSLDVKRKGVARAGWMHTTEAYRLTGEFVGLDKKAIRGLRVPFKSDCCPVVQISRPSNAHDNYYLHTGGLLATASYVAIYARYKKEFAGQSKVPWKTVVLDITLEALGPSGIAGYFIGQNGVKAQYENDPIGQYGQEELKRHIPRFSKPGLKEIEKWTLQDFTNSMDKFRRYSVYDNLSEEDFPLLVRTIVLFGLAVMNRDPRALQDFIPFSPHEPNSRVFRQYFAVFGQIWEIRQKELEAEGKPGIPNLKAMLERLNKKVWEDYHSGKHNWAKLGKNSLPFTVVMG